MKDSYITAGIKLDQLFRLLKRNKLSYTWKNILRLAFLFQSSFWSSFFSLIEKAKFTKALKNEPVPDDPIFIIGHWRTGSTLLHQLMCLDPQLIAPTLFQVALPDSFLVSYPYYRPIFKRIISEHRPMDQVKIGMDEPQEDEYAIYRTTGISPLEDLVFPKSKAYFLLQSDNFIPPDDKLENWQRKIQHFYKKLRLKGKRKIVSKNPFNSYRIQLLYQLFPKAKFIHIHRHPYDVVPSTIHMWDIVQKQNCLNSNAHIPTIDEVLTVIDSVLTTINKDLQILPSDSWAEIRFDELEKNPVPVLQTLYAKLGLQFLPEFEINILNFFYKIQTFKKNGFSLTEEENLIIKYRLKVHMERYGYR
ncbi:MAG: sulfotransferase [Bacteroidota bacterium]